MGHITTNDPYFCAPSVEGLSIRSLILSTTASMRFLSNCPLLISGSSLGFEFFDNIFELAGVGVGHLGVPQQKLCGGLSEIPGGLVSGVRVGLPH